RNRSTQLYVTRTVGAGPGTPSLTLPRRGGGEFSAPSPLAGEGWDGGSPPPSPSPVEGEGNSLPLPPLRGKVGMGVSGPPPKSPRPQNSAARGHRCSRTE